MLFLCYLLLPHRYQRWRHEPCCCLNARSARFKWDIKWRIWHCSATAFGDKYESSNVQHSRHKRASLNTLKGMHPFRVDWYQSCCCVQLQNSIGCFPNSFLCYQHCILAYTVGNHRVGQTVFRGSFNPEPQRVDWQSAGSVQARRWWLPSLHCENPGSECSGYSNSVFPGCPCCDAIHS